MRPALLAVSLALVACGDGDRAPMLGGSGFQFDAGRDDSFTQNFDAPGPSTTFNCSAGVEAGICACTEIGQKPTTLYVVLDRSGSMLAVDNGDMKTRWDIVTLALLHARTGVLRKLGGRVATGLALFPGAGASGDGCAPGTQYFPPTVGSPEVYDQIAKILTLTRPKDGATPTAATLVSLAPKIKALPQPAFVLLATDGAPNCGTTPCGTDRCTYNIESMPLTDGRRCDATINCCDVTKVTNGMGWGACIDADATKAAVTDLATAGIKTFVFGIPGSGPYAADLNELAKAGGTAREEAKPGEPLYYAAAGTTQEAFTAALSAVAAKVIDTCVITLESVPSDPGITNVLLDGTLIPQDPVDGWTWTSDGKVELKGASCARVTAGEVSRVAVAVGCKTVTR